MGRVSWSSPRCITDSPRSLHCLSNYEPHSVGLYKERGKGSKHTIPAKMPFECIACGEPVKTRQEGIECDGCHCWQHRTCCPNVCRAEYRQAYRVGYMDGKCQECIAITSVVATTIDLADLATSTGISVAPASAVVAASNSAHAAANDTALDTAPVADGSLDNLSYFKSLSLIPSGQLPLYLLTHLLHKEAMLVTVAVQLIHREDLERRQRAGTQAVTKHLDRL